MKIVNTAVAALALALAGCNVTDAQNRLLEKDGALRVDPAPSGQRYDFVVSLRNVKDVGYDPDDRETRNGKALQVLREQCPTGRVVGETVVSTGEYALGGAARTYAVQVRCRA